MRVAIYGLEDPRTRVIRYVGETDNVYRRFFEHVSFPKPKEPRDFWIQELKDLNLMVIMRVLEMVEGKKKAREREAYWINHCLPLAMTENVTMFNRMLPLSKSSLPVKPLVIDEQSLMVKLQAIPDWENKLAILSEMIGGDRRDIWQALFGRAPGGRNNEADSAMYETLVEAFRYQYRMKA